MGRLKRLTVNLKALAFMHVSAAQVIWLIISRFWLQRERTTENLSFFL